MKMPNAERAVVPPSKIVDYLLCPTHRAGRSKAAFFMAARFSREDWPAMRAALLRHAAENEVNVSDSTEFGVRYVVDGPMEAPDGRLLNVRSVWYVDSEGSAPRFVTAHPLPREQP